jgi:glutamate dehydrogenase
VGEISTSLGKLMSNESQARSQRMRADYVAAGAPEKIAAAVVRLYDLDGAVGLAHTAKDCGVEMLSLTRAFVDLGARLGLDWAQQTAARMSPSDPWERLLVNGLARDFQHMRLDFLRRHVAKKAEPQAGIDRWASEQDGAIRQFRLMIARAQNAMPVLPAMLAQVASQARNLLGR